MEWYLEEEEEEEEEGGEEEEEEEEEIHSFLLVRVWSGTERSDVGLRDVDCSD